MIPDRNFLRRCAHKNNLSLSWELEDWLLVHFEDEPYEDFNTASVLEDMVCLYVLSILRERQAGRDHPGSCNTLKGTL